MTLFDGELGPHEFKPGACAWPGCGKWHTNEIHIRAIDAPVARWVGIIRRRRSGRVDAWPRG